MRAPRFGLCDSCTQQRVVRTGRGSVFTLCERSRTDPAFPKYPAVPVLRCRGFAERGAVSGPGEPDPR